MLFSALAATALAAKASATKLYVSSYTGTITTLDSIVAKNGSFSLAKIQENHACAPNASWIHLDAPNNNLYCLDENIVGTNGSLNAFKVCPKTGNLTLVQRAATLAAPVNSALYTGANGNQLLATAHYASGLMTWKVDPKTASFTPSQTFNFTLNKPGPNAARQAGSHPHQVLVDPGKKYLVIPDLGGDLLRIFYIEPKTLQISARPSIPVIPGSGPRHGTFHGVPGMKKTDYYYYLVTELSNTLTGYKVDYLSNNGGLKLTPFTHATTYGPNNATAFAGNAAAEIQVVNDGKELLVSNRNATFFDIANPDRTNSTMEKSDTLATFSIAQNGTMKFKQLSPAGGSYPRSFSEVPRHGKGGTLVAVGLQNSGRVVVYEREKKTGLLGKAPLADWEGLGQVTSVVWGR